MSLRTLESRRNDQGRSRGRGGFANDDKVDRAMEATPVGHCLEGFFDYRVRS